MNPESVARAALKKLIKDHGSRQLSEALGCSRQAVEHWDLIPLVYIRKTFKLYGLGLEDLRPDIAELARLK